MMTGGRGDVDGLDLLLCLTHTDGQDSSSRFDLKACLDDSGGCSQVSSGLAATRRQLGWRAGSKPQFSCSDLLQQILELTPLVDSSQTTHLSGIALQLDLLGLARVTADVPNASNLAAIAACIPV